MKSRLSNKILESNEIHYGHDVEGAGQDLAHQNLVRDQSAQRWPEVHASNVLTHYRAWRSNRLIVGIVQQRHGCFLHDLEKQTFEYLNIWNIFKIRLKSPLMVAFGGTTREGGPELPAARRKSANPTTTRRSVPCTILRGSM